MRTNFCLLLLALMAVALTLPAIQKEMLRRQAIQCATNMKNIGTAMEMYSTDFSGRYPDRTTHPDMTRQPASGS